jgi:hypothetical protein
VWTKHHSNVAHLQEFGIPVWVLDERENWSKLNPKSIKQIFVGFEDGPKAIKYYDMRTHCVKTSHNYSFAKEPVHIQGEQKGEQETGDVQKNKEKEHPRDNLEISPWRSTRPRIQCDYNLLNDPYDAFDPAPELAALACDPDEGQPIFTPEQVINYAFKAADEPLTLKRGKGAI